MAAVATSRDSIFAAATRNGEPAEVLLYKYSINQATDRDSRIYVS